MVLFNTFLLFIILRSIFIVDKTPIFAYFKTAKNAIVAANKESRPAKMNF